MSENKKKPVHYVLWVFQVLLALLFLWAGGFKLAASPEMMSQGPVTMPVPFLRLIGLVEFLGALGLILPSALRIKPGLTPLAAAGLVIVMAGATVISLKMGVAVALMPLVAGLLSAFVAYGRWKLAPIPPRNAEAGLSPLSRSQA